MPDEYNESLEKLDIFDYIKWFPSRINVSKEKEK